MKMKVLRLILRYAGIAALLSSAFAAERPPATFSIDPQGLMALRSQPKNGPVFEQIRDDAERALRVQPITVTSKEVTPPSGYKHDYMSLATYWWPDPNKVNGLPYIRRDGERNPEVDKLKDHELFDRLIRSVHALALGYYVLGEEKYAQHAGTLLRVWFLDPATRMNPNLQFAQGIRGINTGRGTGLIETRFINRLVDALGLLEGSGSLKLEERAALRKWFADFLKWMRRSKNGIDEAKAENNHGTYYDVQVASMALLQGDRAYARRVLLESRTKRLGKLKPDGSQPLELARTRSWGYSVMNLTGLFELAKLGDSVGADLWRYRSKEGCSLRAALDFLVPYASGDKKWEYTQIQPLDPKGLAPVLLDAALHYKEPKYRDIAVKLDPAIAATLQFALTNSQITKGKQ